MSRPVCLAALVIGAPVVRAWREYSIVLAVCGVFVFLGIYAGAAEYIMLQEK
jgi:hypothetical protein